MSKKASSMLIGALMIMIFQFIAPAAEAASKDSSGMEWSTLTATESNNLNDITINDEHRYVAVGDDRIILYSLDGKQWSSAKSPSIGNLESVASNGKGFVTVGSMGSLLSSKDGTAWTLGKLVNPPLQRDLYRNYDATYPKTYKSVGWGQKVKLENFNFRHVIWDGKRYIAIGSWMIEVIPESRRIIEQPIIATSVNGIDWNVAPLNMMLIS